MRLKGTLAEEIEAIAEASNRRVDELMREMRNARPLPEDSLERAKRENQDRGAAEEIAASELPSLVFPDA
jgi:hypothetical protein